VVYKRNKSQKWQGPAKIVGFDRKEIIVKHGSQLIRVHEIHLELEKNAQKQLDAPTSKVSIVEPDKTEELYVAFDSDSDSDEEDQAIPDHSSTNEDDDNFPIHADTLDTADISDITEDDEPHQEEVDTPVLTMETLSELLTDEYTDAKKK